jgi:hypothetical protein
VHAVLSEVGHQPWIIAAIMAFGVALGIHSLHFLLRRAATHRHHYARKIVGEHVQRHFTRNLRKAFRQEVRRPTVSRRRRMA